MAALVLFHFRVGARVAALSFAPLFCAIVALVMLNLNPAATVVGMALGTFGGSPSLSMLSVIAALSLFMSFRAAPRITQGSSGWMRHLAIGSAAIRRTALMALVVAQAPLVMSLGILALVAHSQGAAGVPVRLFRVVIMLAAAAFVALPVERRWVTVPLSVSAAFVTLSDPGWITSIGLLGSADLLSGKLREPGEARSFRSGAGGALSFRITWRALGWRLLGCYLAPLIALGATALFVGNNALPSALNAGVLRFGCSFSLALLLSRLSQKMARRRPAWHFARSLPASSMRRIMTDCSFMSLHTAPLVVICAAADWMVVPPVLAVLPLLCLRAAGYVRTIPEHRVHAGLFVLEGFVVSATVALLPWTSWIWLPAAVPACYSARGRDRRQKVSLWHELHFASEGDTLAWGQ